jgi:transposase
MKTLPQPWTAAMEATIFTGWIYDHLKPHGAAVKVAHPLMLRAIAASKKKNDRIDASRIADCLRCDFVPECYMDSSEIRERRRTLRYRNLLVRQVVQLKTRVASLLMETGVSYDRQQLHRLGFVSELLAGKDVIESIRPLLRVSQDSILRLRHIESALIRSLQRDPLLADRVRRLQTVPCVGRITALTWALEMGDISRFRSIRQASATAGSAVMNKNPRTRPCARRFPRSATSIFSMCWSKRRNWLLDMILASRCSTRERNRKGMPIAPHLR